MAIACVLWAVMGCCLYSAHRVEPGLSVLASSAVRVVINLMATLWIALEMGCLGQLAGDRNWKLWLWGVLGAVTVTSYFLAIAKIGMGEATFLQAGSGLLITALAPVFLKEENSWREWIGAVGCFVGVYLIACGGVGIRLGGGAAFAIGSGVSAAFAYLVLSKTRQSYSPLVVMAYWSVTCFIFHFFLLSFFSVHFPTCLLGWGLLMGAAFFGTAGQFLTTLAYQKGPTVSVTQVSYLTAVITLFFDAVLFQLMPGGDALLGCGMILFFGLGLPLLGDRKRKRIALEEF